ncbi:VOC family protein [Aquimarina sp. 2201CG14-23]|uniref:VOC family protein n=1 Tax=Aquimarina mycalae TaxID=3040073 RepID=UPI002478076C|nr:hypothetical protein [Aquimarina sp. 2201CG14-23]MDH7445826.1 hypothetical protein [Aquimarina sp. 2201CG14-23]
MEIKSLKIYAKHIEAQKVFYRDILGFTYQTTSNGFKIDTQENSLYFQKSSLDTYYHFAFLIPTGAIHQAILFLENKNITLLPYRNKKIIQFDHGKAIYFYDKDHNIVEFIERPLLDYPSNNTFSIEQVIKLNEIGLPHKDPLLMANTLIKDYGINPINKNIMSEKFCWVGDHNGVIIVTKEGRNWLPTNKPGIINDFTIHYEDEGKIYSLSFDQNRIK